MNCLKNRILQTYIARSRTLRISWTLFRDMCKEADDEPKKDEKAANAKKKLMSLLSEMQVSGEFGTVKKQSYQQLAKPKQRIGRKKEIKDDTSEEMKSAIKSVASIATEGSEIIESELKESIKKISLIDEKYSLEEELAPTVDSLPTRSPSTEEIVEDEVAEHMMSAVKEVASMVTGEDDAEQVQSDLTKKLLSISSDASSRDMQSYSMEKLFKGLKVEKAVGEREMIGRMGPRKDGTSTYVRKSFDKPSGSMQKINIFAASPLNIFSTVKDKKSVEEEGTLWKKLQQKELKSLVQFAPNNAFEEMIQWTEQGKHWKLPIDNECDMGPEEDVGFHEHVFLEQHLDGFPTRGAIRHFMELVCVGLSKNPYISVERKIENIDWFRNYFKEKEHILREYELLDEN